MNKLLIGFIICAAFAAWKHVTTPPAPAPRPIPTSVGSTSAVHIYTTESCGYCKKAKAHMQAKGISYVEYDVEKDEAASDAFRKYGGRGVPLLVVGENVIHGWNADELDELVAARN